MTNLYKNIKKYREEKGMSQDELALQTGYTSRSSIAKIEKGLVDLPHTKISAFADALGVSPNTLMGWDIDKPQTIAAHLDTEDLSAEELDDVAAYIEFIKNRRK